MGDQEHWDKRYAGSAPDQLTWYQAKPERSLSYILASTTHEDAILDVGAGALTLIDHLLREGYSDCTLLDLSEAALAETRARLGGQAEGVKWIAADITQWAPPQKYKCWHDRAVFHFLTTDEDRAAYKGALLSALVPGGTFIIGTFALGGPEKCSGLPICQYDVTLLGEFLGDAFTLQESSLEDHPPPAGKTQLFQWAVFRRRAA